MVTLDEAALTGVPRRASTRSRRARPRTARSPSTTGRAVVTKAREVGQALDPVAAAADASARPYLADEQAPVAIELDHIAPDIDAADVQEALDTFANPALSGPVTLVFGGSPVQLSPQATTPPALRLEPLDGELVPALDEEKLVATWSTPASPPRRPVDATVALVNGKPKVIPAKPGVTYEPADRRRTLPRPGAAARGRALDRRRGHGRRAGLHDQGRQGAEDPRGGVDASRPTTPTPTTATSTSAAPPS